ncbi:hypothetical protein ACFL02_01715, partial [Planctomycetota bacterium]
MTLKINQDRFQTSFEALVHGGGAGVIGTANKPEPSRTNTHNRGNDANLLILFDEAITLLDVE